MTSQIGSYATDLSSHLTSQLAFLSPAVIAASSTKAFTGQPAGQEYSDATHDRLKALSSAVATLSSSAKHAITLDKFRSAVQECQSVDSVPTSSAPEQQSLEAIISSHMAITAYKLVIGSLMEQGGALADEDDYWSQVEGQSWETGKYLVQTSPSRFYTAFSTTLSRFRATTNNTSGIFSREIYRNVVRPSLLVTSLFPELAASSAPPLNENDNGEDDLTADGPAIQIKSRRKEARRLLFLTLSPLLLTRQEIAQKRSRIADMRKEISIKIGLLSLGLGESTFARVLAKPAGEASDTLRVLESSAAEALVLLDTTLGETENKNLTRTTGSFKDVTEIVEHVLDSSLPIHNALYLSTSNIIRRPSRLTQTWPYIITIPFLSVVLARTAYNSRETIQGCFFDAKETVRGFLVDWVFEPVRKILETVRHGDDNSLALMGKESLRSDLDSLERMVVDFGRDEYKLSDGQLSELAEKVRVGDLTTVLRAWEQDIKSPFRSAVGGSLVRTLLIQVQKVKVDVALAMDGIERMLRSQQLTFAFVGVAPSMVVLYGAVAYIRSFFRRDKGKGNARVVRRKVWRAMRNLDTLLTSSKRPAESNRNDDAEARLQGNLLLELQALRSYAISPNFPTRDRQIRELFLDDVRALENQTHRVAWESKRVIVDRLWRWSSALGWESIV